MSPDTGKPIPTLDQLVAGITEDNRHGEFYTGPDVGKEAWASQTEAALDLKEYTDSRPPHGEPVSYDNPTGPVADGGWESES